MPSFSYTFGAKEDERPMRWYEYMFYVEGYPQSITMHFFTSLISVLLGLQWRPRDELCEKIYKWQPVWFIISFSLFKGTASIELWLPIWVLKQEPMTRLESVRVENNSPLVK